MYIYTNPRLCQVLLYQFLFEKCRHDPCPKIFYDFVRSSLDMWRVKLQSLLSPLDVKREMLQSLSLVLRDHDTYCASLSWGSADTGRYSWATRQDSWLLSNLFLWISLRHVRSSCDAVLDRVTRSIGHVTFPDDRNFDCVPIRNACRSSCTRLMRPYACDTGRTSRCPHVSLSDTNPSAIWKTRSSHLSDSTGRCQCDRVTSAGDHIK